MTSRAALDVGFVAVITVVTLIGALLPKWCFGNGKRLSATGEILFHLGNMLAAGAILGTALCDLLPESVELLSSDDYPLALCLAGVGYIFTLFMEVVVTALSGGRGHSHNISLDESLEGLHDSKLNQVLLEKSEAGIGHLDIDITNGKHIVKCVDESHAALPKVTFISAVVLSIALSYHSMMAGAAIGAQKNMAVAKEVMLAVLGHKGLEAYALGTSLVESKTSGSRFWFIAITYCMTLPIGVFTGYFMAGLSEAPVAGVLSSLSAGTFFFVALNEIVPSEMSDPKHRFKKLLSLIAGFGLMAVLPIFVEG